MIEHDVRERHAAMHGTPAECVPACSDSGTRAVPAVAPQKPEHVAHYPLDIPLPDYIYEHRPVSARDLMLHRIMADFMTPTCVAPRTYEAHISYPAEFDPIKAQYHQLGMDLKLMRKMLFTSHYQDPPPPAKPQLHLTSWEFSQNKRVLQSVDKPVAGPPNAPPTIGEEVIDLVQRYYFETDGAVPRLWLERQHPPRIPTGPRASRNGKAKLRVDAMDTFTRLAKGQQRRERKQWRDEDTEHLRRRNPARASDQSPNLESLYDGGPHLALVHRVLEGDAAGERLSKPSLDNYHYTMASPATGPSHTSSTFWERGPPIGALIQPRWCDRRDMGSYCSELSHSGPDRVTGRGRPKTRFFEEDLSAEESTKNPPQPRCRSEPPPGSYCAAKLPDPGAKFLPGKLMIMFPRLPLSLIDRRSRRRSLSRSHIANMFDWDCKDLKPSKPTRTAKKQEQEQEPQITRKYITQLRDRLQEALRQTAQASQAPAQASQEPNTSKPETKSSSAAPLPTPNLFPPCPNCASKGHPLNECVKPCGYCGAPNPKDHNSAFHTRFRSHPRSRAELHISGPNGDSAREIFIAAPEGHTLIINGDDTIWLSPGGVENWTHSGGGARDRVYLSGNVDRLAGVQADEERVSSDDDECGDMHMVAVRGAGKHGNPHMADKCPVPREARCKCVAFPQFHVAGAMLGGGVG
ncbi:hypothetical protein CONLIGDRAFT_681618 [Coniochaeta ligniaria NRRL 30616]|uniref:Uncharacterized protein n=1 Tax=Coniochaeta ligniaria NRRL 30616 TaxID=1408157 RepID=A0A1J7J5V6_9PEZI|nr:hypothetical protein CONLIGDRAFT_681618 [Coniochaeta ligniaria NRRL 30616]